jgi:FAD synthase
MLCPLTHRVQKLQRLGIDVVVVQPFTQAFSQLSAAAFIEQALVRGLHARAVVVGDDFRFGHRRAGDVATLQDAGAFEVLALPRVLDADGMRRFRRRASANSSRRGSWSRRTRCWASRTLGRASSCAGTGAGAGWATPQRTSRRLSRC